MTTPINGSTLCLECALCCDGSILPVARLHPQEIENAHALGLVIRTTEAAPVFHLPCHLLNEKTCSIYDQPERPQVCGGFRCELLKRYLSGEVDLIAALDTVHSMRDLLAEIQACMPFGRDKHVTFRAIRLMTAYISTLDEHEREQHSKFLNAVTKYLHLLSPEFVRLEESTQRVN